MADKLDDISQLEAIIINYIINIIIVLIVDKLNSKLQFKLQIIEMERKSLPNKRADYNLPA